MRKVKQDGSAYGRTPFGKAYLQALATALDGDLDALPDCVGAVEALDPESSETARAGLVVALQGLAHAASQQQHQAKRLAEMESALGFLTARVEHRLHFEGAHEPGRSYGKGALVQANGGALWVLEAAEAVGPPPGNGWKMLARKPVRCRCNGTHHAPEPTDATA